MDTYDEILSRMTQAYSGYAGFTPAAESDIMIRLRVLAAQIYQEQARAEFIRRQLFPATAAGEYLDRHAAERGITRKQAARAAGTVVFYPEQESHGSITVPAGTQVCTGADMKRFTTDSDVVLSSSAASVQAAVTAAEPGADGNALVGAVSVIVTPVLGIGSVSNTSAFTGGADAESDDELRARVIDSYANISNGANAAYYKRIASSVEGVYSASVVSRGRGNGTVDVYISARGAAVSSAIKSRVQAVLNEGREINTDVLARDPELVEITLYFSIGIEAGLTFSSVAQRVRAAVSDHIRGLGIGADVKLSEIGEIIYHTKGVTDYHFVESYGSDSVIPDTACAVPGTIMIWEE